MLSAKNQKEIASQRTIADFPYLIKISHPDYIDMYFANSSKDVIHKGITYEASTFTIQLPDRDGAKIGNATLTISAIDQFWIERIRTIQKPAALQFIAVIVNDGQVEELENNSFTLRASNWNEISITWEMIFDENMAIVVPADKCNAMTTPGCA